MDVLIIGNGGHSKVIQDMIACYEGLNIVAIFDHKYHSIKRKDGMIYAPIHDMKQMIQRDVKVIVAIGNNETRREISSWLNIPPSKYLTLIHPAAVVSPTAMIGNGTVVMPHALINAGAVVGRHCIINTGAIVEHDNVIGNYAHLSPNATLTGSVDIGEGSNIGASATIIPGIHVGSWTIIGAGSTVIKDIPSYATAVGSPARLIEQTEVGEKTKDKVVTVYEET